MIDTRDPWPVVASRIRSRAGGRCEREWRGLRCPNTDRPAMPLTVHLADTEHQGRATDDDLLALCPEHRDDLKGPAEVAHVARAFTGTTADSAPLALPGFE